MQVLNLQTPEILKQEEVLAKILLEHCSRALILKLGINS
jgi:hypothetical protein